MPYCRHVQECVETGCGCTPEECGLASLSCNASAEICTTQLLQCDPTVASPTDQAPAQPANASWVPAVCTSSLCLGRYFSCMALANCTSLPDTPKHVAMCLNVGCTNEQCRVGTNPEASAEPDPPASVTVSSLLGARLRVQWTPSTQAITWARSGSHNIVLQYHIALLQHCLNREGVVVCSEVAANATSSAFQPLEVSFGGLQKGVVYQAIVSRTQPGHADMHILILSAHSSRMLGHT